VRLFSYLQEQHGGVRNREGLSKRVECRAPVYLGDCSIIKNSRIWVRKSVLRGQDHFGKLDPDTHQSGKLDPDPHQSEKLDPDPHQSEKQDLDPHQIRKVETLRVSFLNTGGSKSGKK
jgi:hypothetical protein